MTEAKSAGQRVSTRTRRTSAVLLRVLPVLSAVCVCVIATALCGCGRRSSIAPPQPPVRLPAEFEPTASVMLRWRLGEVDPFHLGLVENIIAADAVPIVLVEDNGELDSVSRYLRENGVPPDPVHFVTVPTNSLWVRD